MILLEREIERGREGERERRRDEGRREKDIGKWGGGGEGREGVERCV